MVTVWGVDALTGYELECRDIVLSQLRKLSCKSDLHLVFGMRYRMEEYDLLLFGPRGIVNGDLKYLEGKLQGSYNGRWLCVHKSGKVTVYNHGSKTNPFKQVMIQREVLGRHLVKTAGVFRPTKAGDLARNYIASGVVQVPLRNEEIKGIDLDWFYIHGLDEWLRFAVSFVAERRGPMVFEGSKVANWLSDIGCEGMSLDKACANIGGTQSDSLPTVEDSSAMESAVVEEQRNAAEADANRHLLIIAGPGAGKTHVLEQRVKWLHDKLRGEEWMAVVTYTNSARNELNERLSWDKHEQSDTLYVGTVHQFSRHFPHRCGHFHRLPTVLNEIRAVARLSAITGLTETAAKWVYKCFAEGMEEELSDSDTEAFNKFRKYLRDPAVATFQSLLGDATEAAKAVPQAVPRFFVVDEYQDSSPHQVRMMQALAEAGTVVSAVGDPEQAIFTHGKQITAFETIFPNVQTCYLSYNHRSAPEIVKLASAIRSDKDKLGEQNPIRTDAGKITILEFSNEREQDNHVIAWIQSIVDREEGKYKDCAILYRENRSGDRIRRRLKMAQIPVGRPFVNYTQLALTIRLLSLLDYFEDPDDIEVGSALFDALPGLSNALWGKVEEASKTIADKSGNDEVSFAAVLNNADQKIPSDLMQEWRYFRDVVDQTEATGKMHLDERIDFIWSRIIVPEIEFKDEIHKRVMEQVVDGAKAVASWSQSMPHVCHAIRSGEIEIDGGKDRPDEVTLSTIHSYKGREIKAVALIDVCAGIFPNYRADKSMDQAVQEQRMLHVAVSRARDHLIVCCPKRVHKRSGVSQYVALLNKAMPLRPPPVVK